MSNRGRFGKYGEVRRLERLFQAGFRAVLRNSPEKGRGGDPYPGGGSDPHRDRFTLRRAVASDAAFVEGLSSRVFGLYGPYGEIVARWFASGSAVTFVAQAGKTPAGFAMIGWFQPSGPTAPMTELLAIAVEPREQGTGVGGLLMRKMEEAAVPLRVRRLFLHTASENTRARRLFARCGYSVAEVKQGFYPAGQDAVLMFKDLS